MDRVADFGMSMQAPWRGTGGPRTTMCDVTCLVGGIGSPIGPTQLPPQCRGHLPVG